MYLTKERSCLEAEKMCELSVWCTAAARICPRHQEISRWESYYNEKQSCNKNWIIQRLHQETLYLEGLTSCLSPVSLKGPHDVKQMTCIHNNYLPSHVSVCVVPSQVRAFTSPLRPFEQSQKTVLSMEFRGCDELTNILSTRHGLWTCRESTSLSITSSLLNVTDVSNEKGMEGELWSTLRAPCVVSLYSAVRSWLLWEAIKM